MPDDLPHDLHSSRTHRRVTAAFGIFLMAVALLIVAVSEPSNRLPGLLVALVLAALGVDALLSALRGRRSLVSRIGPLP